jgi:hypothetical protein
MKSGRNPKVREGFPKSQTCEECGSPAKRTGKALIAHRPVATYECKNKHVLKLSR